MVWLLNGVRAFFTLLFSKAVSLFPELLASFLFTHGKKFGFFLLYAGIISALTASYFLLANNLINGIHQSVPQIVNDVWGWVMPYNAIPCLFALSSARILKYTYLRNKEMINKKINILTNSGS
ncbi:DUF5455 family protein [Methylomicrobium sp. Wu6]|uniref:DUF5455 family protein n=1 Tax=Methylomicrobium sp. Wu6 TaxID=3107928 RepID=UPI002DD687A1|nr:DUF5455 family protein [Methylomicrobium sp. Wu6]MEC4749807.1 DUF5455 family protein [Methylomicrobium sp. Wu6]